MKRASELSSSVDTSSEKKVKRAFLSDIPSVVSLDSLQCSSSSENLIDLQPECAIEIIQASDDSHITQDDECLETEASSGILVEFMDITEPLTTLRSLLEQRTGVNLSDFQFYLQDSQELEASKNLVNQCVQGEGLVQINVDITHKEGIKKINIVDVLKPAEEIPMSPSMNEEVSSRIFLLGETSFADSSETQQKSKVLPADSEQVTRWTIAPDFKKIQEKGNIPHDPTLWTSEHVKLWMKWAAIYFKIPKIDLREWNISGKQLLDMSQENFLEKISLDASSLFWTHMELLRKFKIVAIMQSSDPESVSNEDEKGAKKKIARIGPPKIPYEGCLGNHTGNNGQIQLWQFLLELLTDKDFRDFIQWVGNEGEFKLINPEMVAQLWGQRKNKPTMNYEKLSRALRYYYDGEMLAKVHGKRFVYKFVCDLKSLLGYDAFELNRLVTECEMKKSENYSNSTVYLQTVESDTAS